MIGAGWVWPRKRERKRTRGGVELNARIDRRIVVRKKNCRAGTVENVGLQVFSLASSFAIGLWRTSRVPPPRLAKDVPAGGRRFVEAPPFPAALRFARAPSQGGAAGRALPVPALQKISTLHGTKPQNAPRDGCYFLSITSCHPSSMRHAILVFHGVVRLAGCKTSRPSVASR